MTSATAVKLKQVASYISRGTAPSYVETSPIQVINQSCVSSNGLDLSRVKYHDPENLEKVGSWIQRNDILVNSTGTGTLGRVAFVDKDPDNPVFVDGHVTILRDDYERFYPKFIYHYLSIQQERLTALCSVGSTNQIELNRSRFGNLEITLPSFSQQRRTADYLDRETAKIDALIAAKQRLLELLGEKRRSLINHAVTRGLNKDVLMKYSDIDWLGNIPKHWEVVKLRWFVKSLEQGWSPQADERGPSTDEWGVLKLNAVKNGEFDSAKAKALPKNIEIPQNLEIRVGDFLITRANTPELVGNSCYVEDTRPFLILSDLIYRLCIRENQLNGKFLSYFLQTPIGRLQIKADARGSSTSMVKISQGHILDWLLVLPPVEEQQKIVKYIDAKANEINNLSSAASKAILLLQERRTSLISAAVTGQIQIPA